MADFLSMAHDVFWILFYTSGSVILFRALLATLASGILKLTEKDDDEKDDDDKTGDR